MQSSSLTIEPQDLHGDHQYVVLDCRFSLADPADGFKRYQQGHIPGAFHLDLERDLSGPTGVHGGRHPLPGAQQFAATLARYGVGPDTEVVAYDDSRLAFAARLWWMMRALGYRPPRLLNGGYRGFVAAGGVVQTVQPEAGAIAVPRVRQFTGVCDIEGLRNAQAAGALLIDAREARRYEGLEEPIDPVAGHIPGALNRPWQGVTDDTGHILAVGAQREHWGDALAARELVVYCGSGVTACVNLFSLALLGRDEAMLYGGSWSDWCSHLAGEGGANE